eukprot:jgi/Botrbrau1/14181/Bobra.182_3s0114.1
MPVLQVGGPVPATSRQGREKQRYDKANGNRMVAGCLPVKVDPDSSGVDSIKVLMISSSQGKGLVFPKGGWETDECVEAAAARETVEEAGVRGNLESAPLGPFTFLSGKLTHGHCVAYMFAMHVEEELEHWPEENTRQRRWCTVEEAVLRCRHPWMRDALLTWLERQGHDVGYLQQIAQAQLENSNVHADVTTMDPLTQSSRAPEQITAPT